MIRSFACTETEKIFQREFSKRLPTNMQQVAYRKLKMLNRSSSVQDLRVPPAKSFWLGLQMDYDFEMAEDSISSRIHEKVKQMALA